MLSLFRVSLLRADAVPHCRPLLNLSEEVLALRTMSINPVGYLVAPRFIAILIMLMGAKLWYLIWFYLVSGKRHWKRILEDPFYGAEWRHIFGE